MTFSKYKELEKFLTINEINEELFIHQKKLFELKVKKLGKKTEKSSSYHLFSHYKRRIAQLQYKKSILLKIQQLQKE